MIYEPSEDSFLLGSQVSKFVKNKSFLDMGSGSGIQSEIALKSHASSVLAVDKDQKSVSFLKSKNIPAIKSDLFSKINKNQKFDIIAFNPPYLPYDKREDKESQKVTTGGKLGDEIILKFLPQAVSHLSNKGLILLLVSSLTPQVKINTLLKKLKLSKQVLAEEKLFMEKLEVWKIEKKLQ